MAPNVSVVCGQAVAIIRPLASTGPLDGPQNHSSEECNDQQEIEAVSHAAFGRRARHGCEPRVAGAGGRTAHRIGSQAVAARAYCCSAAIDATANLPSALWC